MPRLSCKATELGYIFCGGEPHHEALPKCSQTNFLPQILLLGVINDLEPTLRLAGGVVLQWTLKRGMICGAPPSAPSSPLVLPLCNLYVALYCIHERNEVSCNQLKRSFVSIYLADFFSFGGTSRYIEL